MYYPVTITKSKEKFRIIFSRFSTIRNSATPSPCSNFSTKIVCCGIVVFVSLHKSIPMSL